ncbi:MAG: YfhO family protein, partial [Clostridia bacterium]|nr:YfhO family protein [Clostridia bacterium]
MKYIIAERDDVLNEATAIFDYPDDNMTTYRNNYALSIASAVSQKLTNAPFTNEGVTSPFIRLNSLVSYMLGDPDAKGVFREAAEPVITKAGVSESTIAAHSKFTKYDEDITGEVNYNITVDSSEPLYCYFPSKYTRDAELFLNDKSLGDYFESDSHTIVYLGRFAPGETIKVTIRLDKKELYVEKNVPYFWYFDTDRFEEAFGELGEFPLDVTYHTEDTIEGRINVPKDRTQIFTSIPYDAGWRVVCDGETVETYEVLDGLLTFNLTPGEHELSMKYEPESVKQGNLISLMGIAAFILIAVSNKMLADRADRRRASAPPAEEDARTAEDASEEVGGEAVDTAEDPCGEKDE